MDKSSVGEIINGAVQESSKEICAKRGLSNEEFEIVSKAVNKLIMLAYKGRTNDVEDIKRIIEEAAHSVH